MIMEIQMCKVGD